MIWHSTEISKVLNDLETDDKKGLVNGVADMRLQKYGHNIIRRIEKPRLINRFLSQLNNKTTIILIVLSLVSFIVSRIYGEVNTYSPLLIIGIVIINTLISSYHIHNCNNVLENIKNYTNPNATVIRDGITKIINSAYLVPGDIILLSPGDYIPSDARIISCNEFRCNESTLTGEDVPVEKSCDVVLEDITPIENRQNMVFYGCSIVHGTAKAVVVSTGLNTEVGKTSSILQQTNKQKLLFESQLDTLSKITNIAVLLVCIIVFIIGMIQNFSSGNFASMTLKMLVNSIALAVAAIPEGLPAIATIVIAIGIQRMIQDNIIIKDSSALEFLGTTNVICADKTGILTKDIMNVTAVYDGAKTENCDSDELSEKSQLTLKLATVCSTLRNDSTEQAIQNACLKYINMSTKDVENVFPKLGVIPFDSDRKCMTVISMIHEKPFAIVKGAPEFLLDKCISCDKDKILKVNDELANQSLRVICIAMKPLDEIPANPSSSDIENELSFVGLIGLEDPPADSVVEDIRNCSDAGIRTVMITGDNVLTAKSVARRIGLLKDDSTVITGDELKKLSEQELNDNIDKFTVFARVSSDDKFRIVKALQYQKNVVTITGDSVKDADALVAADVGCAMGKFGTDVAKGNADIVISNNSFNSIFSAIKESRGLLQNIKKSVYYLFSCNIGELLTVLIGMIVFAKMPIGAVHLLWINLLTDCAPAIALSMENAENSAINSKQNYYLNKIFDISSVFSIAIQSIFIAGMTLVAFAIGNKISYSEGLTMAFGVLGLSEIFHSYNNKFLGSIINKQIFKNTFLNFSAILTIFIIIFLLVTPAGYVFGLTVLSFKKIGICLLLSILIIPLCELLKLIRKITIK